MRSVQFSCSVVSVFLQPHVLQHTKLPCSSQTPGVLEGKWLDKHEASSVQLLNCVQLCNPKNCSMPEPTPRACSNSCPFSQWCHPTVSSSVVPFSSCLQSFPPSGYFPMSQNFASSSQSTGVAASASFLPKKSQGWSPSEWTGWISLQSKGLSRVFSNTTVQKHQFFGAQLSSQSNSHIHTWPLEKP